MLTKATSKKGESPAQALKKICIYNRFEVWNWTEGRDGFISNKCPVDTCTFIGNDSASEADAVLFNNVFPVNATPWQRPSNQVRWCFFIIAKNIGFNNKIVL